MERHLSEDGLLIITSHGKMAVNKIRSGLSYGLDGLDASPILRLLTQYHIVGYGYEDYPSTFYGNRPSQSKEYGISIISRHWFEGFFAGEVCGVVGYLEQAWDNHQDVLFVKKKMNPRPLSRNRAPLTAKAGYFAFRVCRALRGRVLNKLRPLAWLLKRLFPRFSYRP